MRKLIIAILIGWVVLFTFRFEAFEAVENMVLDKLSTQTRVADDRIIIVAIDNETVLKAEGWSRGNLAELLDDIASAGPIAVFPNILLEESTDPLQDQALKDVLFKHDTIFLPFRVNFDALRMPKDQLEREYLKMPIYDLPEERMGHINILPDRDDVVRKMLPGIPTLEEDILPIINIRLANLLLPAEEQITWNDNYLWYKGTEEIFPDKTLQFGVMYATSPTNPQYPTIPAWEVTSGIIDRSLFEDRIVLVGYYTGEHHELYTTPFNKQLMNSTEVNANILQAILDDALFSKLAESYGAFLALVIGMMSFAFVELVRFKWRMVILIAIATVYTFSMLYYFKSSLVMLPYAYVLFALLLAFAASCLESYLEKRKEAADIK